MRDRDAARPTRVSLVLALCAAILPALAACAAPAAADTPSLEQTLLERDSAAAEAHATMLERSAVFLRDKWGPVALPDDPIERWVAASSWGTTVARCLSDAGFPGVAAADGGERLDYSGVRITEARELFEIDVASYRCQSLYPVRAWFEDEVRDIEAPWAAAYTRAVLVPCLLANGYEVPPAPDDEAFRVDWRTDAAFDSYALVGDSVSDRSRAQARCPAAETVLDGAP